MKYFVREASKRESAAWCSSSAAVLKPFSAMAGKRIRKMCEKYGVEISSLIRISTIITATLCAPKAVKCTGERASRHCAVRGGRVDLWLSMQINIMGKILINRSQNSWKKRIAIKCCKGFASFWRGTNIVCYEGCLVWMKTTG